tara:strand:- start:587 stop:1231 length:645 start_codon:yes stop_codon:yes gene_type:complete
MAVNEKYLDHLQSVITRHNSNSFMIKGWTITICTAVFALSGTWKEPIVALVALVPISVFWVLDSLYLANERCFVSLYTAAINEYSLKVKNKELIKEHQEKSEDGEVYPETELEINSSQYSMNIMPFRKISRNNWQDVFKSNTIAWFYIMLSTFSIALFIGLLLIKKPASNEPIKVSTKIEADSLFIRTDKPEVIINNIILNDSIINSDTLKNYK